MIVIFLRVMYLSHLFEDGHGGGALGVASVLRLPEAGDCLGLRKEVDGLLAIKVRVSEERAA